MRDAIVPVKNVIALSTAGHSLMNRPIRLPGMGLIDGPAGFGKTTGVTWFVVNQDAHYVRSMAAWRTPNALLRALCRELEVAESRYGDRMLSDIAQRMSEEEKPLFIDEADYLIRYEDVRNTLRDLHDMTSVPVILVGMGDIEKNIRHDRKLDERIARRVRFEPCDLEDARKLANTLCEVSVADDLLADLHKRSAGSIRFITVGLSQIEEMAMLRDLDRVTLNDYRK